MASERAEGIVLRKHAVTETSLIVTWYTREFGKLKTIVKGGRRIRGPFAGKIDLFYRDELLFLRSRRSELHILQDCHLVQPATHLRDSVIAFLGASYICELVEEISELEDPHPAVFDLLAEALDRMPHRNCGALLVWFELQLLDHAGWGKQWRKAPSGSAGRILTSVGSQSAESALRIRLTEEQLEEARKRLWAFWDSEIGRPPRSRPMVVEEIRR